MKTPILLTIPFALALAVSTASAQNGPGSGRGCVNSLPPLFSVFDTDRDGVLTASEISGATAALMKLDANRDGKIDSSELCPAGARGAGRGAGGCPGAMALFDADQDGTISAAEAQGAPAALKALDTDHDGKISAGAGASRSGGWGAGRGCRGSGPRCPR